MSAAATMNQLTTPLRPSEMTEAIEYAFMAKRAPLLHGDPGVGKSELVLQAADRMFAEKYGCEVRDDYSVWTVPSPKAKRGLDPEASRQLGPHERPWFIDFRTALHDAVDLTGVPYVEGGVTRWAAAEMIKDLDPRGGVWFFDEINRGSVSMQNACFSLILTGTLGKVAAPSSWLFAAAINDRDAGLTKMPAALNRRFSHLDATTDLEDVCQYAVRRGWEPVVIAFLRMRPHLLNLFGTPSQAAPGAKASYDYSKDRVSPNPRAWEFISQLVSQNIKNKRVEHSLFAGNVGDGPAVEFSAFLRMYKQLPSLDAILLNPKKAEIPTDTGVLFAISAALGRRANAENFSRVVEYARRMPVEFAVFAIKDATLRDVALGSTTAFTSLAVDWGRQGLTL